MTEREKWRTGYWLTRPAPMRKPAAWKRYVRLAWMNLWRLPSPVRLGFALILLVLVTLLAGCATQSPPATLPRNPQAPQPSEPIPQKSYSSKAQTLIESWRERLMGTPGM